MTAHTAGQDGTAVVVGASMAGLLAARVLAEHVGRVVVLDRDTLPEPVVETHVSLFDGTNAGIALKGRPVFSVQHHPEASPGPTDSLYLFERFAGLMDAAKG